MRITIATLIALHGLLHLLGAVHGLGLMHVPSMSLPISRGMGWLWLGAALLMVGTALAFVLAPRSWWALGALAVVVSQVAIASSWADARFGTIANVLLLIGIVVGAASYGPTSLFSEFRRDLSGAPVPARRAGLVTDADLAPLPPAAARFLRRAGVVGRPHANAYRAVWRGRIRSGPNSAWMPLRAEQHNVTSPPTRYFYMEASMLGVPIDGYHRYAGGEATMRVRAAGLVPVARAEGDALTEAETVTLLNDMCVIAPATLLGPEVSWVPGSDPHRVGVTLRTERFTVRAELVFDDAGDLVDFVSRDRSELRGAALLKRTWSTPLSDHRAFGALRLPSRGSALWHEPEGAYPYIELELIDAETT